MEKYTKTVCVGVVNASCVDQMFLTDRDENVPLYSNETDKDAIALWLDNHSSWIRRDEYYMVKVIKDNYRISHAHTMYRK